MGSGPAECMTLLDYAMTCNDPIDLKDTVKDTETENEKLVHKALFDKVPNVTEDHKKIRDDNLLVDGDKDGYLIQIFSENAIGPIFFEFIQRKNNQGFGEGNFGALFRAIERDQRRRGVL